MRRVGISGPSRLAAEAGARVANQGGNAVDAAVAASFVSLCVDVAFVSPGASGFIAIWAPDSGPLVLDAYTEVPGRGLADAHDVGRGREVHLDMAGGVRTFAGYESVGTPGGIRGLATASERFGRLPWKDVVEPALHLARTGSPLTAAGAEYFRDAAEHIHKWNPESRRVLWRDDVLIETGELLQLPGLADSIEQIAEEGAGALYGGALGERIAADFAAHGGRLTLADLAAYEAIPRAPLRVDFGAWDLALNAPPAVGGVTLAAMLLALQERPPRSWTPAELRRFMDIQRAVLEHRRDRMGGGGDATQAARELLESLGGELPGALGGSASTVHTSAVDTDGLACAITLSDGYGSGVMVPGTGMWMNNALGEVELFPSDRPLPAPGTRLVSNMAPTIGRRADGAVLAIGSPGASRITTTLAQVLVQFVHQGMTMEESVLHPRLHVDVAGDQPVVVSEAGLPLDDAEAWARRTTPEHDVFFGGVQSVVWQPDTGLSGSADPRRDGAYAEGGD